VEHALPPAINGMVVGQSTLMFQPVVGPQRTSQNERIERTMTEAYCVKCKKKTEIKNPQEVTMKNGRHALKGTCSVCGTTTQSFLSEKKA
jgi:hypothetical protein